MTVISIPLDTYLWRKALMKQLRTKSSGTLKGHDIRLAHRHGVHYTKKEEMNVVLDSEVEMWDDALHELYTDTGEQYEQD